MEIVQQNEDAVSDFEKDRERVFDRLEIALHKVDSHLTFEFGPKEDGRREFTISADGIREAFPNITWRGPYTGKPKNAKATAASGCRAVRTAK